jgi:lipid A 3-O-deacylase
MKTMPLHLVTLLLLLCLALQVNAGERYWLDGVSVTAGESDDSDGTEVLRLGIQKRWSHIWFDGGAWYLGGYWDTELAFMEVDRGSTDEALGLSITPVFRYQRDARLSSGITPFAEAGLGFHLLSETNIGDNNLSTAFQFGSLFGLGVGFGERGQYELSYRFTHISNGDIKKPNDGLDLHLLKLGYNFN